LQFDQQPAFVRKDRHISAPLFIRGGVEVPMSSLSFMLGGTKFMISGLGCKLITYEPRPPNGDLVLVPVKEESVEASLEVPPEEDPRDTAPGTIEARLVDGPTVGFFGYARV
jgi:hypothetical protein